MNDAELIKRCLSKDKKAWNLFIQKYSRLIYWAIQKRLSLSGFSCNQADIEDIFQDVFVTILRDNKLLQLKNAQYLAGWLSMIASSRAVDFMRRKAHREHSLVVDPPALKDITLTQQLSDRDFAAQIKEIVASLSDRERIIISLNVLEGKTHKEIAHIVGSPINTISTVIARTKEKIKNKLRKRGTEDFF